MKPIIKWTGGKRKEIKIFSKYIPEFDIYVEPFFGGGATFWHLCPKKSIINDFDYDLMNFYKQAQNKDFTKRVEDLKKNNGNHKKMERLYYDLRNLDREGLEKIDDEKRALRFLYINQLAFSGMRRFNSDGHFNVPFGHYKSFNPSISKEHISLLASSILMNKDGVEVIEEQDKDGVFMFLDPPYTRVFKEYSSKNSFGEKEQRKLAIVLKEISKAKWMLIIDDSELTQELYKEYIFDKYSLSYGVNIKNRFDTKVSHLIITNYNKDLEKIKDQEREGQVFRLAKLNFFRDRKNLFSSLII